MARKSTGYVAAKIRANGARRNPAPPAWTLTKEAGAARKKLRIAINSLSDAIGEEEMLTELQAIVDEWREMRFRNRFDMR